MLLYITRKYPPSVGGMQRFNYKLVTNLKNITDLHLISWGGSQAVLPFFLIYAFITTIFLCLTKKIDCIYVSDSLLSPLGLILKWITQKPVIANTHGRDIAFNLKIYQMAISFDLPRLTKVLCVSEALKEECLKRGVPEKNLYVIPNGVDISDFDRETSQEDIRKLAKFLNVSLINRKIIITVGRLVPKKGTDSFLTNIFPKIIAEVPNVLYLIVGDGPLKEKNQQLVADLNLGKHVFMPGQISMDSGMLATLYHCADVFAMPNVPVEDDMEGFGIVALEGGASATPVVASGVDGITEAIINGENGILVPYNDYSNFAQEIIRLLKDDNKCKEFGRKSQEFVKRNYSWEKIAERYKTHFTFIH